MNIFTFSLTYSFFLILKQIKAFAWALKLLH